MPNPAVKPSSADGTTEGIRGRVGRCQIYFTQQNRLGNPQGGFAMYAPLYRVIFFIEEALIWNDSFYVMILTLTPFVLNYGFIR